MNLRRTLRRAWQVADVDFHRWLMRPPRSMPFLMCMVTFRCNSRCRMCECWRTSADQADRELTTEEWFSVIDQGVALGAWAVSFSGGEPLLRGDLAQLVRHAHRPGVSVHLCTNGVLLDAERARALMEAGLGSVNVSLDSVEAAIHNDLRRQPIFDTVVSNIRGLRTAAPALRVGISSVVTRRNYQGLARMVRFAEPLGVRTLRFAPIHTNLLHHHMDLVSFGDLPLRIEDLPAVEAEMRRALAQFRATGLHRNSRLFLRGIGRIARGQRTRGCLAGFATACVDPYGWVTPCPDIEALENVRQKRLADIWRSPAFGRLRRRVHNCQRPCWDTSYAELSLRFQMRSTLADPKQFLGELRFYLRS